MIFLVLNDVISDKKYLILMVELFIFSYILIIVVYILLLISWILFENRFIFDMRLIFMYDNEIIVVNL